jgi:5-hydroxyisourate hydrolase
MSTPPPRSTPPVVSGTAAGRAAITTHVLDTSIGKPAAGVAVSLEVMQGTGWAMKGRGATDADGRARDLLDAGEPLHGGTYRLRFETGAYFRSRGVEAFFPHVEITFVVSEAGRHHHVPLLLSPFGYSTYRGN